jgi:hypothetical protein
MGDPPMPCAVQASQHGARVAIAEIGLRPCRVTEQGEDMFGDPARSIAAAPDPQHVDIGSFATSTNAGGAGIVVTGEVTVAEEALGMEADFHASGEQNPRPAFAPDRPRPPPRAILAQTTPILTIFPPILNSASPSLKCARLNNRAG